VFNDLEMVSKGKSGLSREMLDPWNQQIGHLDRPHAGKDSDKTRQNPLALARSDFRKSSAPWNEGVVSMLRDRPVTKQEEYRSPEPPGNWTQAEPSVHANWFALWRAHGQDSKLFASVGPSTSVAPAALIRLGAEIRSWAADPKNRGKLFEKRIGEWELKAKAVPFRHRECLSCHPKAKIADPAAVAVVAVRSPG
jgi:hypothetical protein